MKSRKTVQIKCIHHKIENVWKENKNGSIPYVVKNRLVLIIKEKCTGNIGLWKTFIKTDLVEEKNNLSNLMSFLVQDLSTNINILFNKLPK